MLKNEQTIQMPLQFKITLLAGFFLIILRSCNRDFYGFANLCGSAIYKATTLSASP